MDRKYNTVKKYILDIIFSMKPGEKLPSERDLIEKLGFSRATIQRALLDLEKEGYLYKVNRRGTFIADRKLHKSMNRLTGFRNEVLETGAIPTTQLLDFSILSADGMLAEKLGIKPGEKVYRTVRLRKKNGVPIIIDFSYFTAFAFEGATAETLCESIYDFIEKEKNLIISCANQVITAEMPPPKVAKVLEMGAGKPVIRMDQTVYLADGRAFEYTISYKNPQRYVLTVTATR